MNFSSYEEVEAIDNFVGAEELEAYRRERLSMYADHLSFFKKLVRRPEGLRLVEVGSGSSVLLYALESEGLLDKAVGIELSTSRYQFAEQWKREKTFKRVENINADFSKVELDRAAYDCFVIVDNTFSYLCPENEAYPARLLQMAHNCLTAEGRLLIEINNYMPVIAEIGEEGISFWKELPESNAFEYSLYRREYNRQKNILRVEGIYLSRQGEEKRKSELSYVYNLENLGRLFNENGFAITGHYADFRCVPFAGDASKRLVVIGEKKKR